MHDTAYLNRDLGAKVVDLYNSRSVLRDASNAKFSFSYALRVQALPLPLHSALQTMAQRPILGRSLRGSAGEIAWLMRSTMELPTAPEDLTTGPITMLQPSLIPRTPPPHSNPPLRHQTPVQASAAPPEYDSASPAVADTSAQKTPRSSTALPSRPPHPREPRPDEVRRRYSDDPATESFAELLGWEIPSFADYNNHSAKWSTWFEFSDRGDTLREHDFDRFMEGWKKYKSMAQSTDGFTRNLLERLRIPILRLTAFAGCPWFETPSQRVWLANTMTIAHEEAVRQHPNTSAELKR